MRFLPLKVCLRYLISMDKNRYLLQRQLRLLRAEELLRSEERNRTEPVAKTSSNCSCSALRLYPE